MTEAIALLGAALPLLAALSALLLLRWPATRAAALGCGLALLLVALLPAYRTAPEALADALLSGLVTTLAVVYVVYGGLLLYHIMEIGGANGRIATALAGLGADRTALALLLVLGWAPFVEAASGFGVAAAVTCPLLLALGFPRRRAILLSLLGLCAVPWGALAIGLTLGAQLTGLDPQALGAACALLNLPLLLYVALLTGALAGGRAAWRRWPFGLTLAFTLGACLWAVSRFLSVELAGLVGGLAALAVGGAWLALERGSGGAGEREETHPHPNPLPPRGSGDRPRPGEPVEDRQQAPDASAGPLSHEWERAGGEGDSPSPTLPLSPAPVLSLARAATPYALLVGLLLATRLIGPVAAWLRGALVVSAPDGSAHLPVIASAGFWLLVAGLGGAAALGLTPALTAKAAATAGRRWLRPALATAGFVALGQIMLASGMTTALAGALANLGPAYLPATALLGAMGGYLTGSNAGANAMFATLSAESARQLGLAPITVVALLNTAASNVTMASPSRVLLALAVAGIPAAERPAEEAAVNRRILAVAAGMVALLALAGALMAILPLIPAR